jgi:hypothetical protein
LGGPGDIDLRPHQNITSDVESGNTKVSVY